MAGELGGLATCPTYRTGEFARLFYQSNVIVTGDDGKLETYISEINRKVDTTSGSGSGLDYDSTQRGAQPA